MTHDTHTSLRIPAETAEQIDEIRTARRPVASRSAVIRQALDIALPMIQAADDTDTDTEDGSHADD